MNTPIYDFVCHYAKTPNCRFHMPGHKGENFLGCELYDITEIPGADSLFEASGIIAESQANAGRIFDSGSTFYSAEGSSLVIKAMLHLVSFRHESPVILAARNVHKSFIYGCALNDIAVEWLYPKSTSSFCSCIVDPLLLKEKLQQMTKKPVAVYVTSPDYLGNMQDISSLAKVCREFEVPLLVDNAHGAYLKFLPESLHPLDLGVDMCCDSAHKTLPVLTGGAYFHIAKTSLWSEHKERAVNALALFGSTSPSYLILQSLDLCNKYLADKYDIKLLNCIKNIDRLKQKLSAQGYDVLPSDPLKLTLQNVDGLDLAKFLFADNITFEYADLNNVVMMLTPENSIEELLKLEETLLSYQNKYKPEPQFVLPCLTQIMSIREAVFADWEVIDTADAAGRICSTPLVSCPPAVPVVSSGEIITQDMIELLLHYNIYKIVVVK